MRGSPWRRHQTVVHLAWRSVYSVSRDTPPSCSCRSFGRSLTAPERRGGQGVSFLPQPARPSKRTRDFTVWGGVGWGTDGVIKHIKLIYLTLHLLVYQQITDSSAPSSSSLREWPTTQATTRPSLTAGGYRVSKPFLLTSDSSRAKNKPRLYFSNFEKVFFRQ